jgi:hypothetical protein
MQRNRQQEKKKVKDKNIKDNNIEVIVNIGNENNDESEKNTNSDNYTETKEQKLFDKGLKQNENIMNELLDDLKKKIKEFNNKKEQLINRKIDIPNNIFALPDIEINSKEDVLQLIDVLQNKINQLNNLLVKPLPLANQISYQRGGDLNVPQQQQTYIPFAGLRPSDFYRPEAYEPGNFVSDKDSQNLVPVQPNIPVLPDEPVVEPVVEPVIEPVVEPPTVPELPRQPDTDEFGPDPDSDYEDEPVGPDEIVPPPTVSPYLENLESRKYILSQYINSQLNTDYNRSKNVRAMIANENAGAYNEINKGIQQINRLTENEYNYLMNLFVTQDITPEGSLPAAIAYRHYTTEPLDLKNDLISARLVELPGGTLPNPNARRIYQLVINDDIKIPNYFFTVDGDIYDNQDENTDSSTMPDTAIGEGGGRRPPGGRNSGEYNPDNPNNAVQGPSVNPDPIFGNPINYQDDGGLSNIDFTTGPGLISTIGSWFNP